MGNEYGFTVVEVTVTIAVITILLSIALFVPSYFLVDSRDAERSSDVESIARRLEQSYNAQTIGKPAYPHTTKLLSDINGQTGTVSRVTADTFVSPNESSSSVVAATSTSLTQPLGATAPTVRQYVYQPLTQAGSLCTQSSQTCVKFNIFYRLENGNSLKYIKSMNQQ